MTKIGNRGRSKVPVALAVFGLFTALALAGCPNNGTPTNGNRPEPVLVVVVLPAPNHGIAFQGEEGTLNYLITVVGEGVFPIDFPGSYLEVTLANGDALPSGIAVNPGTVAASNEPTALRFTVNRPNAATYSLRVRTRGGYSAPFQLRVAPSVPVDSVEIIPAPAHGVAVAGVASTLNYLLTIASAENVFPVIFPGPNIAVTLYDGTALPAGIAVNGGSAAAPGEPFLFSFAVNRPNVNTYSLIATVHGRPSAPFDLAVVPGLMGTVTIDGYPFVGYTLTANITGLAGAGTHVFTWQRGIYPNFDMIQGANGQTYVVRGDDSGQTVRVLVEREGYHGHAASPATLPITNPQDSPLGGTVTIDGYAFVGETLTANIAGLLGDADRAVHFTWQRGAYPDFAAYEAIAGANSRDFIVTRDELGSMIRVIVSRTGYHGSVTGEPVGPVETLGPYWESVSAGARHTVAVMDDGTLWAWGYNLNGRTGLGRTAGSTLRPERLGNDTNWAQVAAGGYHTVAIRTDGTLWAWGGNLHGQLGLPGIGERAEPTQVGWDTNWASVATRSLHTVAIRKDGTLWAWGTNDDGQLGLNDTTPRAVPTRVGGEANWSSVSAGWHHTMAVRTDGTLWAWGRNDSGRTGFGETDGNTLVPTRVGEDANWVSVSAGGLHTVAIRDDGTLWIWGSNSNGATGQGVTGGNTVELTQIEEGAGWAFVSTYASHNLAVGTDGSLWAWGTNLFGQIGNDRPNFEGTRSHPVQIMAGTYDWVYVNAGGAHSMGIREDGTLWAWGSNVNGTTGLGTTQPNTTTVPTLVPAISVSSVLEL